MRKLASIQKILKLEPIPGADNIEKAKVLGWQLVVKKGEFKEGDLCVYCEIDSILPDRPEFEFLGPNRRIKTAKIRKQISQGICFGLSILPDLEKNIVINNDISDSGLIGQDCTDILGIIKYESEQEETSSKNSFPEFVHKTDETRVQNLQGELTANKDKVCYITEKLDGSSITFYLHNGEFGVCSRNINLDKDPTNNFWKAAIEIDIETKLRDFGRNIAIQGELVGEGIQKNPLKLKGKSVFVFSIFNIDTQRYVDHAEFMNITESLKLTTVPIIQTDYILSDDINEIITMATRKSVLNNQIWAEGLVIRPLIQTEDFRSFKAINPEFLLKFE